MTAPHRITHVRYVGLGVPDLADQLEFYRDDWGLIERENADGLAFLGAVSATDPYILRLRQTESTRVDVVSFAVRTPEDVDSYAAHLGANGVTIVRPPGEITMPGGGYGLRFLDPDGRTLEIAAEVTPTAARELEEKEWVPGKLSHVVLNTPDLEASTQWYGDMLGLLLSDRLATFMTFLRADSPWHHTLALASGPRASMNHVAYESRGLDEYMRATGRLMRAGYDLAWGPGRHGPGENTFSYFLDRAGYVAEYTTALEQVADWSTWTPRVHPTTPEWSDQWGTACARNPEPFLGPHDAGLFDPPPV